MAKQQVVRTFNYRAGVRVRDTVLACDATSGSDLIFISHAEALDGRAARHRPRARSGKRRILTTETTLALLGAAGERLRPHALTAAYGRPFNLGGMRIELFRSGGIPGSASLLCEREGQRLVYAGPVGHLAAPSNRQGEPGGDPAVRVAGALCLDGTFGSPRFAFPDPQEALAAIDAFVVESLAAGRAPIVLGSPAGPLLEIGERLGRQGVSLRAHRRVMMAAAAYRSAGLAAPPMLRFNGSLGAREALLWPPEAREAPILKTLARPALAFASGWAADPAATARMRVDAAFAFSNTADFAGLLRYVEATEAREVAVQHAGDGELCETLRRRGIDAYPVGPPQQIDLF
jgi:putative mRNA 3-end processing factor